MPVCFDIEIPHSLELQDVDTNLVRIVHGRNKIELDGLIEHISESEDGTDTIRLDCHIIDIENQAVHAVYQKAADWFFDYMFNNNITKPTHKYDTAPDLWKEALTSNCIIRNAKAMRDDREYRTIVVDKEEIEINIKYQYFKVDLALFKGDKMPSIIVIIKGLFDSSWEELPPLLYEITIVDLLSMANC